MFPVTLDTVVDAKVEDPVTNKFPAVSVPKIVDDPEFREVTFAFCAITFPRVVEAKVEDALTAKFTELVVVEFVVEA